MASTHAICPKEEEDPLFACGLCPAKAKANVPPVVIPCPSSSYVCYTLLGLHLLAYSTSLHRWRLKLRIEWRRGT